MVDRPTFATNFDFNTLNIRCGGRKYGRFTDQYLFIFGQAQFNSLNSFNSKRKRDRSLLVLLDLDHRGLPLCPVERI